ncbi:MAG: TSUP family transporter, partial [Clostridia bacterium]|nr:TSUP family transporter [Clostridia bacterium]
MQSKIELTFGKIILFVIGGVLVGVANGLFGGGGGMLCVPMLLLAGLENQKAQATAILIMTPISIASVIVYYTSGY